MVVPNYVGMDTIYVINELLNSTKELDIVIKRTSSPYNKNLNDYTECRVVRQKVNEKNIELIISNF